MSIRDNGRKYKEEQEKTQQKAPSWEQNIPEAQQTRVSPKPKQPSEKQNIPEIMQTRKPKAKAAMPSAKPNTPSAKPSTPSPKKIAQAEAVVNQRKQAEAEAGRERSRVLADFATSPAKGWIYTVSWNNGETSNLNKEAYDAVMNEPQPPSLVNAWWAGDEETGESQQLRDRKEYTIRHGENTYTLSQKEVDLIAEAHRESWADSYDGDDEDQARRMRGEMPRSYERWYTTELDMQLKSLGLPSSRYLDRYVVSLREQQAEQQALEEKYNAQVSRVDEFYKAVAQEWGALEEQGYVDPDAAYTLSDGTASTVKNARERVYFDLLNRPEWSDVWMLSGDSQEPIDPEKYKDDYVGYQEALIRQQQKEKAAAEKNVYSVNVSFDDFANRLYAGYRVNYMNQRIVDKATGKPTTRGHALNKLLREEQQAEWQETYGSITTRKAARQWVTDHADDGLVQVLRDMSENDVAPDQLRQAKNAALEIARDRGDRELVREIKDAYTELIAPGSLDLDALVEEYEAGEASTMTVDQAAARFMSGLEYDGSGKVTSESISAAVAALAEDGATAGVIEQGVKKTLAGLSRAGSYTGALSDVEDAILAATSDELSAYDAVQSSLYAADLKRRTEIASLARDRLTENGYTPFQIDQALSSKGWQDTISPEARAAHYFAEREILERVQENGDAKKFASMTDAERLAYGQAQWDALSASEREAYVKNFTQMADFNPELNRSYEQQLSQQFVGVFTRVIAGIMNSGVNLADMIAQGFDGRTDRWAASETLSELNKHANLYGKVNAPDIGSKLISIGSDIATEVIRMQTLGAAGGSLTGFLRAKTGINIVANAAGTSATAAKGLRLIEKGVSSAPFIGASIGSYFDEAIQNGATYREATNHALVCGGIEGALEAMGFDNWVGRGLGGRKIAQKLAQGGTQAMRKGLQTQAKVISLVSSAIGNGIEEPISYAASTFMKKATFDPDAEFSWKEAADNGIMGLLIGVAGSSLSMSSVTNSRIAAEYAAKHGASSTTLDIILAANQAEMMTEQQRRQLSANAAPMSKRDYDAAMFDIRQAEEGIRSANDRYNAFLSETDADIKEKTDSAALLMRRALAYSGDGKTTIFSQVQEAQRILDEATRKRDAREPEMRKARDISIEQNNRAAEKAREKIASHFVAMSNLFQEDIDAMRDSLGAENFDRNARAAQQAAFGDLDLQYTSDTPDWNAIDADAQALAEADEAFTRRDELNARAQAVLSMTEDKMRHLRAGTLIDYINAQVEQARQEAVAQAETSAQSQATDEPAPVLSQTEASVAEVMQPDAEAQEAAELPARVPIGDDDAMRITQLGQQLGRPVAFVDGLPDWEDGYFENGILYINRNQRVADGDGYRAMVYRVFTHELTHSLEGSASYNALARFAVKQLVAETGVSANLLYRIKQQATADASGGAVQLDLSAARREVVAEWAAEHLLQDEASITRLVREQSGIAGRVWNWVERQIAKLGLRKTPENAEARILLEAERLYARAFAKGGVKPSEAEGRGLTDDAESTQTGAFSSRRNSVATPSWDELIARYGAHPQGMEPRGSDMQTPRRISGSEATSRFVRSVLESPQITDDMRATIQDAVANGDFGTYTPQSNASLLDKAQNKIAQNLPDAAKTFREEVNTGKVNAETIAMGEQLLVDASAKGDMATVLDLCASLSIAAPVAGRATQAFAMLKNLGGVGQAYYVARAVEQMNRNAYAKAISEGRMEALQIDEALLDDLARAKTDDDVSRAMDAICQDIGSQIPPSLSDQLSSWRYLSMLGNPVAHIRNMTGNEAMSGLRGVKDALATGIERAFVRDASQRAHAVYSKRGQSDRAALAAEMFDKYRQDIANGGRLGFEQLIQQNRKHFKSETLDALSKWNSGLLESEDAIFMRGAFESAFTQYLVAQNIDPAAITPEQEGAAARWAIDEAQRATFRDASELARAISNLSKTKNIAIRTFVEGVIPFKKTPINVLKRGIDYSPIGVIEGAYMAVAGAKNGRYTPAQAVDRIASGLTGTALMALGAMLSRLGILRSSGEEDETYETFLQGTGAQTYSLNVGDLSIGISNIAPASIPLFMGATLAEGLNAGDGSLMDVFTTLASATSPLMEMSFLSSLNDVLQSYSNDGLGGAFGRVILSGYENYASQYLPTIGGKVADFADPVKRTSAGSATSPLKGFDSYFRGLARKVPGLSSAILEPSINVKGEKTVTSSFGEWLLDFANGFVLPVNVKVKNRDATDREIMRVFEATGNTDIVPTMPRKYFMVDGQRVNLSASQYTQYAQERGQAVYAAIKQLIKSSQYQSGDDEKKAELLKKAIESAENTVLATWKESLAE